MKKKLLLVSLMALVLACLFAFSVFAENKIIKHNTLPTLEEIHTNRDAYVSHLDAFDGNSYGEIDSESVVVLSDLQDPPTYYVYPSYYYIQNTKNHVYNQLPVLNAATVGSLLPFWHLPTNLLRSRPCMMNILRCWSSSSSRVCQKVWILRR